MIRTRRLPILQQSSFFSLEKLQGCSGSSRRGRVEARLEGHDTRRCFATRSMPLTSSSLAHPVRNNSVDSGNGFSSALRASSHAALSSEAINSFLEELTRAASWNHGAVGKKYDRSLWKPEYCRQLVDQYSFYLDTMTGEEAITTLSFDDHERLLSAETVNLAFKVLLKGHYETADLSERVRNWERALGRLQQTPLTDHLTLRLLTASGKAGNVARCLALLELRKSRAYRPRKREFLHALTALQAALHAKSAIPPPASAGDTSTGRAKQRNIFLADAAQPVLDNPTRWLDAILLNMHARNYPLTPSIARRMLESFASGDSGKALHHFYRVTRVPVPSLPRAEREALASHVDDMPQDWFYLPASNNNEEKEQEEQGDDDDKEEMTASGTYEYLPVKVQVQYHAQAPPFYKVPSAVKGKLLSTKTGTGFKVDREKDPDYSIPLAAAFSFADSLEHGACGHAPIKLDTPCYNALIKASVQRGALWRALSVLQDTLIARSDLEPDCMSYNLVLQGLAKVGDVHTAQEVYDQMVQESGLQPDAFTVRAIVDGLLNLGDIPAAITAIQDFFNQYTVLPPYTTHVKLLELALGHGLVWEAKRYIYFLQQLWHWEPLEGYHGEETIKMMRATQANTQLQKPALMKLFAYFGETLEESDFL